jgi:hypothetical protein
MIISGITISGADDSVDPQDLYRLSDKYPFVEWGILDHPDKYGKLRYPSREWIDKFDRYSPRFVNSSLHLCGKAAEEYCNDNYFNFEQTAFSRIQINLTEDILKIHTADQIARILAVTSVVHPMIIQANTITRPVLQALMKLPSARNVQILFDESRGKGAHPTSMRDLASRYEVFFRISRCGFAGRITLANLPNVITEVQLVDNRLCFRRSFLTGERKFPPTTWLDLESGARDDNKFSLVRVEAILQTFEEMVMKRGKV